MKLEPELFAFIEACKKLQAEGVLKGIDTKQLRILQEEIAEDQDVLKDIKKLLKK